MVISGLANLIGDKRKAGFRRAKTSTLQQEGSTKAIEDSKVATMVQKEMDSLKQVTTRADEKMHSLLTAFRDAKLEVDECRENQVGTNKRIAEITALLSGLLKDK